jgi:hypothetical protein
LSERDNKEIPVVKEEETNDTEVFEEVVVEVARLSKEPKSLVSPPPGSSNAATWIVPLFPVADCHRKWQENNKYEFCDENHCSILDFLKPGGSSSFAGQTSAAMLCAWGSTDFI